MRFGKVVSQFAYWVLCWHRMEPQDHCRPEVVKGLRDPLHCPAKHASRVRTARHQRSKHMKATVTDQRLSAIARGAIAVLIVLLALEAGCMPRPRRALESILKDGYIGWVRIEFGVRGQEVLPQRDGRYIVRVPSSGIVRTATSFEDGYAQDTFYYETLQGQLRVLDVSQSSLSDVGSVRDIQVIVKANRTVLAFFVGSKAAYERAMDERARLMLF
jgi:hypothetical protein